MDVVWVWEEEEAGGGGETHNWIGGLVPIPIYLIEYSVIVHLIVLVLVNIGCISLSLYSLEVHSAIGAAVWMLQTQ